MRFTNPTTAVTVMGQTSQLFSQSGGIGGTLNIGPFTATGFSSLFLFVLGYPLTVDAKVTFYTDATYSNTAAVVHGRTLSDNDSLCAQLQFPMITPFASIALTFTGGTAAVVDVSASTQPSQGTQAGSLLVEGSTFTAWPGTTAGVFTAIAANPGRLDATLMNLTTTTCYVTLDLSGLANAAHCTVQLVAGAYYELPKNARGVWRGPIYAQFAASVANNLNVNEFS